MSPAAQPDFDARTLLDRRSLQKILGGKMLHEKVTTVYLKPHVRAQAEDEAAASNRKLSPYLSWLIDQMLNWRFLTNANLEFIKALSMELDEPWDTTLVLNRIIAYVREEMCGGRLVLSGFFFQPTKGKKTKRDEADAQPSPYILRSPTEEPGNPKRRDMQRHTAVRGLHPTPRRERPSTFGD